MAEEQLVVFEVELLKNIYQPGEEITGELKCQFIKPVTLSTATLTWQSNSSFDSPQYGELNRNLMYVSQPIFELQDQKLSGEFNVNINFQLPFDIPVSTEVEIFDRLTIETMLDVNLKITDPIKTTISRQIPLKIYGKGPSNGKQRLVQSIEFPLKGCFACVRSPEFAKAHIELTKLWYTAGDEIEAMVIVDLRESSLNVNSISVALKRKIEIKKGRSSDSEVITQEHELFEGYKSQAINAWTESVLVIGTIIPELDFTPDVESEGIKVSHSALFLFHGSKNYTVETEIPIHLVHPESMVSKDILT